MKKTRSMTVLVLFVLVLLSWMIPGGPTKPVSAADSLVRPTPIHTK